MKNITVDTVNQALPLGLELLLTQGQREESRAGSVLVYPTPVTTVYRRPTQRVLFSPVRDANPFFHLGEALWMLAGRGDARFLDRWVSDYSSRFAEEDGTQHGAYGYRWRRAFGVDQLDAVVEKLCLNSCDRQAVIQMWDASQADDPFTGQDDLVGNWRDRPCNTHAYLRVRGHRMVNAHTGDEVIEPVLDLTVCCRSNDIIWGAYGANAVHFSVLQEYLAARIGVRVGTYYQVSNNYHAYIAEVDRLAARARTRDHDDLVIALAQSPALGPEPLVDNPATFDKELAALLDAVALLGYGGGIELLPMDNKFLSRTAWPMFQAHYAWKQYPGDPNSWEEYVREIRAADWKLAAGEWLKRRWDRRMGIGYDKTANAAAPEASVS